MQKNLQQALPVNESNDIRQRLLCPICGKHTVLWLLPATEIKNLPIKCKRCGQESIISVTPKETQL